MSTETAEATQPNTEAQDSEPPKKRGCFGCLIAAAILVVVALIALHFLNQWQNKQGLTESNLDDVEKALVAQGGGENVGFGNSDEAIAMAKQLAVGLDAFLADFDEQVSGLSLTGDKTLAHAEMRDDSIAFLVIAPRFKKYSDEGKAAINAKTWALAQAASGSQKGKIAVAMRESLNYNAIMTGNVGDASSTEADEAALEDFFR